MIDVGIKFITPDFFENILDSIVGDEVREVHCSLELGVSVQIFIEVDWNWRIECVFCMNL